jgi:hypothetical protein
MAAATQSGQIQWDEYGTRFRVSFSVITSDQPETLSYNYGSMPAQAPVRATYRIKTEPTVRCNIAMVLDVAAANAAAKTVPVRFSADGDPAGAVVDVTLYFVPPGRQTVTPV